MATQKAKKGPRIVIIFVVIILIPAIWFFFLNNDNDHDRASKTLLGKWQRTEGPYILEFKHINPEGRMTANYFNPNPIHVGRSEWRIEDGKVEVYVELQDTNYPGSTYSLVYDKDTETLKGNYYQAMTRETFSVEFDKVKSK